MFATGGDQKLKLIRLKLERGTRQLRYERRRTFPILRIRPVMKTPGIVEERKEFDHVSLRAGAGRAIR